MILKSTSNKFLAKDIKYFNTIDSTNNEIWRALKKKNINEGYTIISEYQTSGKGRRGNKWISNKGDSLMFSILLKPNLPIEKIGLISILSGISVSSAIKKIYNIEASLKWPNDVLVNNKKLAGILVESKIIKNQVHIVIGIGININQKLMVNELIDKAISVRMITKRIHDIEVLFLSILEHLENFYSMPIDTWITTWETHCNHKNCNIKFHDNNDIFEGIFMGLTDNGEAIIKKNNLIQNFSSGVLSVI